MVFIHCGGSRGEIATLIAVPVDISRKNHAAICLLVASRQHFLRVKETKHEVIGHHGVVMSGHLSYMRWQGHVVYFCEFLYAEPNSTLVLKRDLLLLLL
jgi:hypothetical protein